MALQAGFLMGGDTNETPQSLARKRALIAQIMANGKAPTNIGEGLNALGDGIVANVMGRRADKAEAAGQASANDAFAPIAAMFTGGGFGGSPAAASMQTPAAATDGQPPVPGLQSQGGGMSNYRDAIASIESKGSGDYAAVGPTHPKLGRALGRYQVMEANIGPWSQEVLGRTVTPDEFMANPQLQDQIFDGKFQGYVSKFGPEGAAQAWFGGPGGVGKTDRKDSLGTSIGAYGQKFTNALGGAGNAAEAVTAMGRGGQMPSQASAYVDPMVSAPNSQPQPAMAPQQGPSRNGLPFDLVSGSPQLARADTRQGILRALTGQTGPAPGVTGAFPSAPGSSPMPAQQAAPAPSMAGSAPMQAAPAPQPMAQPQVSQQQLIAAINNPWLSESQRAVAQSMLEQQMQANDPMRQLEIQKLRNEVYAKPERKTVVVNGRLVDAQTGELVAEYPDQAKPTPDIQNYEYYVKAEQAAGRQPLGPLEWEIAQKKAGATNISTTLGAEPGDGELRKALDKKTGELWSTYQETGATSASSLQDFDMLDELIKVAPQGPLVGRLAQALPGVSSAADAFQSIVKRVAPTLRAPGSGATSDIEYDGMLRSLPSLGNKPEANVAINQMMRAKAAINVERSRIIDDYAANNITASEARKRMAEVDNRSIMTPELKSVFDGLSGDAGDLPPPPEGIDPADWQELTPEERKLWQN